MDNRWYALAVQRRKESYVEQQLSSLGYVVVCPRFLSLRRSSRKVTKTKAPIFPGYLFVELNLERQNWREVNSNPGSNGLINFGDRPYPLNRCFANRIR